MSSELIERIDIELAGLQSVIDCSKAILPGEDFAEISSTMDVLRDCKAALTQQQQEIYRLERLLDTEPYPSADAYDSACDQLEAWHRDRAKKGLPMLCEGSLVDGLSSILHSFDVLEDKVGKLSRHPLTQQQEAHKVECTGAGIYESYYECSCGTKFRVDTEDGMAVCPETKQQEAEPVAWLYTLEYGTRQANKKVSLDRLRYPFGVAGADYCEKNDDGVSYVRETKLYARPPKPSAQPQVPEGYQLVPTTLSEAMLDAFVSYRDGESAWNCYAALLSAAKGES